MSQARVTDFFSHRKKGIAAPVKAAAGDRGSANTRSNSSKNKDVLLFSSSVHDEFVRVIDEAAGLNIGESTAGSTANDPPCSPRTPKRTSVDAEFDLGAAVFSASADHSTAKKRRQAVDAREAKPNVPEKIARRTARKKLLLPLPSPPAPVQPVLGEETEKLLTPADSQSEQITLSHISSPHRSCITTESKGRHASQTVCKEDIKALKCRLQRIKKHAKEVTSAAPFPSPSSPANGVSIESNVARAKELAARTQRRKEETESEDTEKSTELPAYQRYHNLAKAASPGLSLPYHYKVLAEMFRSMDTIVAMLYNRCETATFSKIKQGVQDMMHKRFEEQHIGQMKTVFPEAYTFRQEKNTQTFNSSIKKGSYQLTMEPIIPTDQKEARPILSASHLLERRHIFHLSLVSLVKEHHKVFLSSLVPPLCVPEDKLTRWHPRFNVDTVPAVAISSLPQPPHTGKLATAQEVLDKAHSLITPKMEKSLVSLVLKTKDKVSESKETQNPTPNSVPTPPVPTALKGVSQSLLERIRAKEAQKLQAAMTRDPSQDERLVMMSRLGELARILRNVFIAEKKPSLIMEVACNRMVTSYRSALSTGEMEKHIHLLAEMAGDWLTIHPIRKDFYLKLNKNMELNIVLDKLSCRLKEEEKH
ncbi:DNA replication factor Cdt1 [Aulostomus maculatus]